MLALRRTTVRALSSYSSFSSLPRTRTLSTSLSPLRCKLYKPALISFPRRWASSEAQEEAKEDAPIEEVEPTADAEIENAMHEDSSTAKPQQTSSYEGATSTTEPEVRTAQETQNWNSTDPATTSFANDPTRANPALSHQPKSALREVTDTVKEKISDAAGAVGARVSEGVAPNQRFEPKSTLYVGNLFFDVTEADLQKEFSKFGTVVKARLVRDARGLSKG